MKNARKLSMLAMLLGIAVPAAQPANAEPATLRHGYQPGLSHLPALVMKNQKLLEACLTEAGLRLDQSGVVRTRGRGADRWIIVGRSRLRQRRHHQSGDNVGRDPWQGEGDRVGSAVPNDLVTTNPKVASVKDFGPDDRISVPSVKVSPRRSCFKCSRRIRSATTSASTR